MGFLGEFGPNYFGDADFSCCSKCFFNRLSKVVAESVGLDCCQGYLSSHVFDYLNCRVISRPPRLLEIWRSLPVVVSYWRLQNW